MSQPSRDLPTPESALVVAAHPDDAEFQCGATLAKWAADGARIHHLILTDGSKGTWNPDADQSELVSIRRDEQKLAAQVLVGAGPGDGEVVFAGHVDGELTADRDSAAGVCEVIRRLRPAVVLSHDPWKRYRLHPDHSAAGWIVINAIVAARDPFFNTDQLRDGITVHRPDHLLLFEADEVNHFETLAETHVETRVRALEAHESQLETTHFYRLDNAGDREDALNAFRHSQHEQAKEVGSRHGTELAEEIHLITDQL